MKKIVLSLALVALMLFGLVAAAEGIVPYAIRILHWIIRSLFRTVLPSVLRKVRQPMHSRLLLVPLR